MAKEKKTGGSLLDRLKSNTTVKMTDILEDSKFFNKKDVINLPVYALNIAFSGDYDLGFMPGVTTWAGPSKHFKSLFSLVMAKAYMDKYKDAILLFYDCEFGTPKNYFKSVGIDMSRVLHTPILNLEELKFDMVSQLEGIERGDHVITIIDSIGNIASKKEIEDAEEGKSTVDMTRSKNLKSLFRIITPYYTIKDIPLVVVNHTYQTLEMFSKTVVSGGTGNIYASDNIFILGKQQEKDGTELAGWNFIINVEKSRYSKEKSKIPILVTFEGGLSKYSGLLDIAIEAGVVVKPKNKKFSKIDFETGEVEEKMYTEEETNTTEFWDSILKSERFKNWVINTYQISATQLIKDDE